MTLHQATIIMKKTLIVFGAIFGGILLILFLFQVGMLLKNLLFPPERKPPTHLFGKLSKITFPENATNKPLTYTINTVTGGFPDFPDRLSVFQVFQPQPNFLNLNKTRQKVAALGFSGESLIDIPLGDAKYEWREATGMQRIIIFNTITFNFSLESNYLSSSNVLNAKSIPNKEGAITVVTNFLGQIDLFPTDIDLTKTRNPQKTVSYLTSPQLFAVEQGHIVPTTSLSNTQVIRVDLYQNDIAYNLNTGITTLTGAQQVAISLPLFYPHPPYSTMNFWVASGSNRAEVMAANFVHKSISVNSDNQATYELKTPNDAYSELKDGKGYIAAYDTETTGTDISIKNIYLGYYVSDGSQQYVLPIYVFEGKNGFIAYVSAINNNWVE